jgi:alginate O-acetyltransferase complex protein AlgJ
MRHRLALQSFLFLGVIVTVGLLSAITARGFRGAADVDVMRGGLTKTFESYYDERFPGKTLGVNLWAAIEYTLFGEGRQGVVVGRQGWLYTDEEFNVTTTANSSVQENLALIERSARQLKEAGVELVVAIVPAKARIYPEFLNGRRPASAHTGVYDRLVRQLEIARIPVADLRTTLAAGKTREPTYFRTDTHWTPWGAQLAAHEIAKVVRQAGFARATSSVYVTRVERVRALRGDLFNFLPLTPYFGSLLPRDDEISVMKTEAVGRGNAQRAGSSSADLFGNDSLPEVTLVGTSYSANALWNFDGALKECLGEDIVNYAKAGSGPFRPMHAYLQSEDFRAQRPRLVIWEIPERALVAPAGD